MPKKKLIDDIVQDPSRFYRAPFDVVRDRRFSDEERLQILGAWEREIREEDGDEEATRLELVSQARQEVERRTRPAAP
ncbi:MAG: hypothetical protein JO167_03075 [Alphaproteobacteria bacterium]|nr:hypothetical protein [Alphaproteobacteria bacterium]MBV9540225.1 hypothetical protein [Alphaproteobacteria bacterium]